MSANGENNSYTKQWLTEKYGALLTMDNLAEVLHRKIGGLRFTLRNPTAELTQKLAPGLITIGRRKSYRVDVIAALIDQVDYPATSTEQEPRR
ncbi:DNA-binding protein [Candidatus Methylospira mobilis]|uniref:DNA-binding protein n=1 Tax=Candidatus Methylospira mobilis TaxID=1808979 RepID=A0A5Q0BES2_9GAMM|nr:DNA-binding protein [Candidatus Methylospira mobilis]QFY42320.1 DNA-binding protein [Candidatus Methylospira mobilis]